MSEPTEKKNDNSSASENEKPSALDHLEVKEELNVEELDQFLEAEDPEFFNNVKKMSADSSLSMGQIVVNDDEAALHEEVDFWESQTGLLKLLYKINPLMPKISLFFKRLKAKAADKAQAAWIWTKNFAIYLATDGRKIFQQKAKEKIEVFSKSLSKNIAVFKKLSWKLKLAFVGLFLAIPAIVFLVYLSATKGLVPPEPELFLNSIESVADEKFEYPEDIEMEAFYDNLRAAQNIILVQKMVVNVKKSKSSGPNPMAAFEFYVEGTNSDVAIEIKDREIMIRDLMMRVLEDFDFDTLESVEGKKSIVARLQKDMNRILTTGRIKNIRIKTVIVKP